MKLTDRVDRGVVETTFDDCPRRDSDGSEEMNKARPRRLLTSTRLELSRPGSRIKSSCCRASDLTRAPRAAAGIHQPDLGGSPADALGWLPGTVEAFSSMDAPSTLADHLPVGPKLRASSPISKISLLTPLLSDLWDSSLEGMTGNFSRGRGWGRHYVAQRFDEFDLLSEYDAATATQPESQIIR